MFLRISHGFHHFPMDFPMVFLGFPMVSHGFPMDFPWRSCQVPGRLVERRDPQAVRRIGFCPRHQQHLHHFLLSTDRGQGQLLEAMEKKKGPILNGG